MAKKTIFDAYLSKDEELLWCAQPGVTAFVLAHMRAVLMGLPFLCFAWVWHGWVMKSAALPAFSTVTWLFLVVGLGYCAVPVMAYVRARWFTYYGLTNARLLIMTLYPRRKCETYDVKDLTQTLLRKESGSRGSLLFNAPGAKAAGTIRPHPGLYGIARVADVLESIHTLRDPKAALAKHGAQTPCTSVRPSAQVSARASAGPSPQGAPSTPNKPMNTPDFTPSTHRERANARA